MKKILFFICFLCPFYLFAQDTFSIVAVDSATGQIGSAGASCIDESQIPGGVVIISDIIPGRGGINTQSFYVYPNQANAHDRMAEGLSPDSIISWLVANDYNNNPEVRQYGIVDFDSAGSPRSAAFTGVNCYDYKNHITGKYYAIQGNILLGQEILDSMETRFLNTTGTLADRLMAALQGANVPGADTRCMANGISSLSSYLRVADSSDIFVELIVPSSDGKEPIDSLQTLYNEWKQSMSASHIPENLSVTVYPNPVHETGFMKIGTNDNRPVRIEFTDPLGRIVQVNDANTGTEINISRKHFTSGIWFYRVISSTGFATGKFIVQ